MPIDTDAINAILEQRNKSEEDTQPDNVKLGQGEGGLDGTPVQDPGAQQAAPAANPIRDAAASEVQQASGDGMPPPKSINIPPDDTFYDIESDLIVPGASEANRINSQYFHGMPDLSLEDPNAVDWENPIDSQWESFTKTIGPVAAMKAGRGIAQTFDLIGKGAFGVVDSQAQFFETAFDEVPESGLFSGFGEAFKEGYNALLKPFKLTAGGALERGEFFDRFEELAKEGDSGALIDLAETARGQKLTSDEQNQIITQFEQDALFRQIASDSLSYEGRRMMLKHTPDRWTNPDIPWLYGRGDMEMDSEEYYRSSISRAVLNGQDSLGYWLTLQQTTANLAPVMASMMAGGQLTALARGATAAKSATVVGRGMFKFSPELLKTAPKTGLIMATITPGTAEEKIKTFGVMTAYAATAAASSLGANLGRRALMDFGLNTAISSVINPQGDRFFEWGGMYREMYRQARAEGDRLNMSDKEKNSLSRLYLSSIVGPDAVLSLVAGSSGKAFQQNVRATRIHKMAKEHWLRTEMETRLRDTDLPSEQRDNITDHYMQRVAVQADNQGKTIDEYFAEHHDTGPEEFLQIVQTQGELLMKLRRMGPDHLAQLAPRSGIKRDANVGDPKSQALQNIIVHQRGFNKPLEFMPAAVSKDEVALHTTAAQRSPVDTERTFAQYTLHPEFGQLIRENRIANYDDLLEFSYEGLRNDIDSIWPNMGTAVQLYGGPGVPYKTMDDAINDMRDGRLLITRSDPDHAELGPSRGDDNGLTYADKLKAIRMYFGHNSGAHDATESGIRNAQAKLSQMFSDGGNIAAATEIGLASTRFGSEQLGVQNASTRSNDDTAGPSELPKQITPPDPGGISRVLDDSERLYAGTSNGARQRTTIAGKEIETSLFEFQPEAAKAFQDTFGEQPQKMHEIRDPEHFAKITRQNAQANTLGASVDVKDVNQFSRMRMFASEDGLTSFGLKIRDDGLTELASLTKSAEAKPGSIISSLVLALEEGAQVTDVFDTISPRLYSLFGGRAVARTAFVDEQAPKQETGSAVDWNFDTYRNFNGGRPDVVFMVFDQVDRSKPIADQFGSFKPYEPTDGKVVDTFEDGIRSQTRSMTFGDELPAERKLNDFDQVRNPNGSAGIDTDKVLAWAREHPEADPRELVQTADHWEGVEKRSTREAQRLIEEEGVTPKVSQLLDDAGDAGLRASMYREGAENLHSNKLEAATPNPPKPEPSVLPPDLADWRRGLIEEAPAGILEARAPKQLLRPMRQRRPSKTQVGVAKRGKLTVKSSSKNAEENASRMGKIVDKYRDQDITDLKTWESLWLDMTGERSSVPILPVGLRNILAGGPGAIAESVSKMNAQQLQGFVDGMEMTDKIRKSYDAGNATTAETAVLSMWGALSPKLSPYPHESAFLEVVLGNGRMKEFITKAEEGKFNIQEYKDWVNNFYPENSGKPGAAAKGNLNSFGEKFLGRMYKPLQNGKYKGERPITVLHRLLSDPNVSGQQLRREWYKMVDDPVGIDIKVLSFMSVLAGKRDVMVLDRVQTQALWDMEGTYGYKNGYDGVEVGRTPRKVKGGKPGEVARDPKTGEILYDVRRTGMSTELTGYRGVALYELFENQIAPIARDGMNAAGLQHNDMGAWHWLTWVQNLGQEVSHSTLTGMQRMIDGVDDPFQGANVINGKFNRFFYGFRNTYFGTKGGDDFRHVYTNAEGKDVILDTDSMKALRKVGDVYQNRTSVDKGKNSFIEINGKEIQVTEFDRFLPKGFTFSKEKKNGSEEAITTDRPWTERDEVNLPHLERWIDRIGIRPNARESEIIASGTDSTGIAPPGRAGIDELLAQDQPGAGIQGATAFLKSGQRLVFLMKGTDVSTAHHEFFHDTFEMLPQEVRMQARPALLKLGIDVAQEGWTPRAKEAIARLYERYLVDGNAPSPDMASMFNITAKHMRNVYRRIAGSPVENAVSPEARAFFDSLYVPDGKYIAPNIGYLRREEQDMYPMIEQYDRDAGRTRKDPFEYDALAKDASHLRVELGAGRIHQDVAIRAAANLPVKTVSYRHGRDAYRRLMRATLTNEAGLGGKFMDSMFQAWIRSGSASGTKSVESIVDAFKGLGIEASSIQKPASRLLERYAVASKVPSEFEAVKRDVGQTTSRFKAWVKSQVDPVIVARKQQKFSEDPVLRELSRGNYAEARRIADSASPGDSTTNALGSYDRHVGARFEGLTTEQTKDVERRGHKALIPEGFREADGFTNSDVSLAASRHNDTPITLYAYHAPSKQLIPAKAGRVYESLTEQVVPGSRLSEWVRIDVDPEGDLVGTSGERVAQIEAFSALRATDPGLRWVPDAEQVPGFYNTSGKVNNVAQHTKDGSMADYTVFPPDRQRLFTGKESVDQAAQIYQQPEFRSWQRRVGSVMDPLILEETFLAIDSSASRPGSKQRLKSNFMQAAEDMIGLDYIAEDTLKEALPGKKNAASRNLMLAMSKGGDPEDVARVFNDMQEKTGSLARIRGVDLSAIEAHRNRFEFGQNESQAVTAAAELSKQPETFFQDIIRTGELKFPDPEKEPQAFDGMMKTMVNMAKKRTKAIRAEELLQSKSGPIRHRVARMNIHRMMTNARYAWARVSSEIGNVSIFTRFKNTSQQSRRSASSIETRFVSMFKPDNIAEALRRNGETPSGKVKDQLYDMIRRKDVQGTIARWLGTEPSEARFGEIQAEFAKMDEGHRGAAYMIRDELQGASAANLRFLQHHKWAQTWSRVNDEYRQLRSRGSARSEAENARFSEVEKELLKVSPFRRTKVGSESERVPVEEMLKVHNEFTRLGKSEFHEFLKDQGWGSREHYWLTVRPEEFDTMMSAFRSGLDPLPRAPGELEVSAGGLPGSIGPRTQKTQLDEENVLNNLFQHMHRYEVIARTIEDVEFLGGEVNKMRHITDEEKVALIKNLDNLSGFGDNLGFMAKRVSKANRWFWNSYILNTSRVFWYTTRNKFQPYLLMASQLPITEMAKSMPEVLRQASNEGSNLRKAFADVFSSDIAEGSAFARQALTDRTGELNPVQATGMGRHFDNFTNSALPFSDKMNRKEVYGMAYTMADRAVRDLNNGDASVADVQRRLAISSLDPAEQLTLMSKLNKGEIEDFKRDYAQTKNLNVNFAYHTGERALLLQDASTRTFMSLVTWPLGATEIVVRNGIQPVISGLQTGNTEQIATGLKSFSMYLTGMYIGGELYSMIFGDKGDKKAYDPLFSAMSVPIESPGQGWIANLLSGPDAIHKAVISGDPERIGDAVSKIANTALYMLPMMSSLAIIYEAVSEKSNVEAVDLLKSTAFGVSDGVAEWIDDGAFRSDMPDGIVSLIADGIYDRLDAEGYSEYRTGWEAWMHGILGTFEESKPDRWDDSTVGNTISEAIGEAVEMARKFMDDDELEAVTDKFKSTHNLDISEF